jgi:formylglycine-generating enzyme required for sulfatase activity
MAWHPLADGCPPKWASAWGQDEHGVFVAFSVGRVEQRLRWIRPGTFLMGSPGDEEGRWDDEGPQHQVTFTRGYWLGDTPVTQALWEAVMDDNPSKFTGDPRRPVEQVSWEDCQRFCAALEERVPGVRLPTEAEWEYACRAGTTTPRYCDELEVHSARVTLDDVAWYKDNSGRQTHAVGGKHANAWRMHDMLGNIWEWCMDWYGSYASTAQQDPSGPATGGNRVSRGASWLLGARYVRAAYRGSDHPGNHGASLGFRLARGPGVRQDP